MSAVNGKRPYSRAFDEFGELNGVVRIYDGEATYKKTK